MKWTKNKINRAKELFFQKNPILSRPEIAAKMKISYSALNSFLGKQGWKRERPKKYGSTKEQFIETATKTEVRRLLTRQTLYEVIGDQITKATKAIPAGKVPLVVKVDSKKPEDEEEICTIFGDSHIGLTVDSKESGGLGAYNLDIFHEEMEFFQHSQTKIFRIHRRNTPYNVHNIFILGDIIENRVLREAQLRLTEINVVQQVMEAVNSIALWIAWLARQFNQINVYCVVGQHGRLIRDKTIMSPMDNLDYLIYKWIEDRLKEHTNVRFNISESWWMAVERMGVKFYLEHGDEFRSWIGIPFYGLKRGKANIRELLRQYLDEKGRRVDFDYFISGHIHTPTEFQGIITNGSFVGGSEYSLKQLKAGEPASQKMFSIHPTFKKTWSRDILLRNLQKQSKIKFYK